MNDGFDWSWMEFCFRSASLPKRQNCAKRLAHQIDGSKDFPSQRCQRQSPTLWKETCVCLQMLARNLMKWLTSFVAEMLPIIDTGSNVHLLETAMWCQDLWAWPALSQIPTKSVQIYCQEKLNQRMNEWAKNICFWLIWLIPSCRSPLAQGEVSWRISKLLAPAGPGRLQRL